ncbi:MAG TPA: YihY/virulence factor BrkB family protein [Candidatus Nitrosotenuis sp.]|nr:YihY/virulence factor BrkB family protein [Candidatus Nitrosotenuis sp.]
MKHFVRRMYGAAKRVFPACGFDAQAIAFNMFFSFFPLLLLALGIVGFSKTLQQAVLNLLSDVHWVLPPGSRRLFMEFLAAQEQKSRTLLTLGFGGLLLAGTQMMTAFQQAFRHIYREPPETHFWREQARALLLLLLTIGPMLVAIVITVFGRTLRNWMIVHLGLPELFNAVWVLVYLGLGLVAAVIVLSLLYHAGRAHTQSWNEALPGALVATLLWWVVNWAFGIYVRRVPYNVVYGGLAAAIGLMIWMYLCAMVILIGAAFNAERLAERSSFSSSTG